MWCWRRKARIRCMPTAPIPEEFAPAKVNLTLHVTGRRADGYHLLDSLVVFAGIGDTVALCDATGLTVTGPMAAGVPVDGSNLVLRAAALLQSGMARPAGISLHKRLPHAAGIGGGSSDAAATLRLLARHRALDLPLADSPGLLALGADVPVCLTAPAPKRMRGIGERIADVPRLPDCALILANPGVAVPTGPVFGALASPDNPPMPDLPASLDLGAFVGWLARCRNDLQPAAERIAPQVTDCLAALRRTPGVLHAAMSGSGATCYGLTAKLDEAERGAAALRTARPGWWVVAAPVLR